MRLSHSDAVLQHQNMPQPEPQPELKPASPLHSLSSLTPETPPQIFLSTITFVLSRWHSGLLSHTHPTDALTLPETFLNLLGTLPNHPWHALDHPHIQFLQSTLLQTLVDSPQLYHRSPAAVAHLLTLQKPARAVLVPALYLTLRLPAPQIEQIILHNASKPHLLSTHLARLLPLVSKALSHDMETTLADDITPAMHILHTLLTTCTQTSLTRQSAPLRELLHPLLEAPRAETRVPALRLFAHLCTRCGVVPASMPALTTSLLWRDPATALLAVPLLASHLACVHVAERRVAEKRVLECVVALSQACEGRVPSVDAVKAAVELLPYVRELVYCDGVRFLRAMGAFLARVGAMVPGGRLEKVCVKRVCDAVVEGVRRWWIVCDAFRAQVLNGCLVCFMEVDDVAVANGVEEVILTLAKCHPGRMMRMLKEVRESVTELAGLGRLVTFLEKVEGGIVDVKEMRRVETGRLVERFFPEVNEFNLTR